jgi:hypothetical protein
MAKYRTVETTFWEDPKVMEKMTPEDKYIIWRVTGNFRVIK